MALPSALLSVGTLIRGAGPAECSPRSLGPLAGRSLNAGGLDIAARCFGPTHFKLGAFFFMAGAVCSSARVIDCCRGRCSANPSCMLRASVGTN